MVVNNYKDLLVWKKSVALGSASELETQIIIGQKIGYFYDIQEYIDKINEIKKMLNGLINSLKRKNKDAPLQPTTKRIFK